MRKVEHCEQLMVYFGIIKRSMEMARLYGCSFDAALHRASQTKIECVLGRVTKRNHFLLLSASKEQVCSQRIITGMPFCLTPQDNFFADPVLVFDFTSLYPSCMAAYNICYSTCLGEMTFDSDAFLF